MYEQIEITTALLAYWRHELFGPLNIIQGYSCLIIEELEEENRLLENNKFSKTLLEILKTGKDIQAIIKDTLELEIIEEQGHLHNIIELRNILEQQTVQKVDLIEERAQEILAINEAIFSPDIEKILKSASKLKVLLGEDLEWLQDYSSTAEAYQAQDHLRKKLDETFLDNRASLLDVEKSLNEIKSHLYTKEIRTEGLKILLVDNNRSNQELLYRQLDREKYSVSLAESGEEALRAIAKEDFDLILLDIVMPGLNGYQVLDRLKHSQWKHIPVIMISSLTEIESITKCIEMGAADYLPKPFNFTLLRAKIDACLENKKLRDQEKIYVSRLALANQEIAALNEQLAVENDRLSTELEITRQLQKFILPQDSDLRNIEGIDVAGFMEPAEEVGGDYYDVQPRNDSVHISIGDVTGHGLESGLLMIMVQTAMRTLIESELTDQKKLLNTLNHVIVDNARKLKSHRNLTLSLINYFNGKLSIAGQHEDVIIVRSDGRVESIDTTYLGFPIGLEKNIKEFIDQKQLNLSSGDIVALYTDGVIEAENDQGKPYGVQRLRETVCSNRSHSSQLIIEKVIEDVKSHIGNSQVLDDMTLLILKQK
ncbi:MAG: SpoIIE family protein phosphatase [Leptolyngbya sp. SIOISBB]|nr:SpoIIE family protein phosphatase [Leptolyngbya sp. SIOISBB]